MNNSLEPEVASMNNSPEPCVSSTNNSLEPKSEKSGFKGRRLKKVSRAYDKTYGKPLFIFPDSMMNGTRNSYQDG